jgi:hypothetical protein
MSVHEYVFGSLTGEKRFTWGSRRYQGKFFGKEDSDDITVGRQTRVYLKKQYVVLYVTTRTERDVTVLDSKIGSVIPVCRLL